MGSQQIKKKTRIPKTRNTPLGNLHFSSKNFKTRPKLTIYQIKFNRMGFAPVSKRFGPNFERLPKTVQSMFRDMQKKGQISALQPDLPEVPEDKLYRRVEQWKYLPGDRVMIVKGEHKGTVTSIVSHLKNTNGYYLEDGPMKKIVVPREYWRQTQPSHVVDYPVAVTRDSIKLVSSLTDEKTGKTKTFAADDVVFRGRYWDAAHKKMLPYRCVKNEEHITIPWPAPEPIHDDELCTPEDKALERSYFPMSVVHSGLPDDLKLSLRAPLARRTIPRYSKKIITNSDLKRLTPPKMPEPPHKELMRQEKKMLAERSIELTAEMKEFIGSKVAQHLASIEDPHMKKYIERVSGDRSKK